MATKPADPALTIPWATDANLSSGPQTGETTKYAPTLSYMQQGCVPGRSAPGRYLNFFFNQLYLWVKYVFDGLFSGAIASVDNDVRAFGDFEYCDAAGAATTVARTKMLPLTGCMRTGAGHPVAVVVDASDTHYVAITAPNASDGFHWDVVLPFGASVTQIRAGVSQGTVGATTQMKLEVFRSLRDKSVPFASQTVVSLGSQSTAGAGSAVLTVSPSYTQGQADTLAIVISCSDATVPTLDGVLFLDISFGDPGPRNN